MQKPQFPRRSDSAEAAADYLARGRDGDERAGIDLLYLPLEADRLDAAADRVYYILVVVAVGALRLDESRRMVKPLYYEIDDLVGLRRDYHEALAGVEALDDAVDENRLEEQTEQGEKTRAHAEDEERTDGDQCV